MPFVEFLQNAIELPGGQGLLRTALFVAAGFRCTIQRVGHLIWQGACRQVWGPTLGAKNPFVLGE